MPSKLPKQAPPVPWAIERDAAAGRLDRLWAEAERKTGSGETETLDEFLRHQKLSGRTVDGGTEDGRTVDVAAALLDKGVARTRMVEFSPRAAKTVPRAKNWK